MATFEPWDNAYAWFSVYAFVHIVSIVSQPDPQYAQHTLEKQCLITLYSVSFIYHCLYRSSSAVNLYTVLRAILYIWWCWIQVQEVRHDRSSLLYHSYSVPFMQKPNAKWGNFSPFQIYIISYTIYQLNLFFADEYGGPLCAWNI